MLLQYSSSGCARPGGDSAGPDPATLSSREADWAADPRPAPLVRSESGSRPASALRDPLSAAQRLPPAMRNET